MIIFFVICKRNVDKVTTEIVKIQLLLQKNYIFNWVSNHATKHVQIVRHYQY